ncbi:hypothetical protein [Candidatus Synechococcus spongiarum]|uniref:Uncharacterized protein n=1 Tax=Candidatus Synechococcus spongiarum TaxID=431041 RepID=A0A165AF99_9SYNE|nr:hypothetical protein [Candidatus Synechococcus spongiarum]SAY38637.1 hypothetical protein FLM9_538 [Candidatus Synechococcus spongiarum]
MNDRVLSEFQQPFRPRARLLQFLGDELISSARLVVFELVKNTYDADANKVAVTINLVILCQSVSPQSPSRMTVRA